MQKEKRQITLTSALHGLPEDHFRNPPLQADYDYDHLKVFKKQLKVSSKGHRPSRPPLPLTSRHPSPPEARCRGPGSSQRRGVVEGLDVDLDVALFKLFMPCEEMDMDV